MPFLKAGFNPRNRDTGIRGWTRPARGGRFMPAELRSFECGDYFWLDAGKKPRFLAWGECVVLGSWYEFDLPWEYQNGLAHCVIDTREEVPAWEWVEARRRKLAAGEVLDD
jgi:hypothetical protein